MGFAYTGHLILSRQVPQFRGNNESWKYTIELAFRAQTLNYVAMKNIGSVGTSFALAMKVLVVGIALKMLLALIIDAYKQLQKEDSNDIRGVLDDFKILYYIGTTDTICLKIANMFNRCLACCGCPVKLMHLIDSLLTCCQNICCTYLLCSILSLIPHLSRKCIHKQVGLSH